MCGIVGYVGEVDSKEILMKGLERLEYRGYDSAGIAVMNDDTVNVFKEIGRISDLRNSVPTDLFSPVGIGHTRWATHGVPNRKNAHPHQCETERFTIVHNGVVENYELLRDQYLTGVPLKSDTDTEVIVQMVNQFVQKGNATEEAFRETLSLLHGSYAIALLDREDFGTIFVAKSKSPLLIGIGNGFHVVASDAMAVIELTDRFVELADKETVILTKGAHVIKNLNGEIIEREPFTAMIDASDIEKGTYPHYMLKEIDEQPTVIRKIVQTYKNNANKLMIDEEILSATLNADRIYIVACGTSYYAGLVGKHLIEALTGIPVETHVASEFSYNMPLLSKNPLFIFITQSGETADSRAGLVLVKELGYKALTITNVAGSTLSREADYTLLLHAGPEIAVASTKAYTAQLAVLSIYASLVAEAMGKPAAFDIEHELAIVATVMETLCNDKLEIEKIATEFLNVTRNCFFIGRGLDHYVGHEGALKLKEISYIQAESFAGGELKHGTIALIEEGTPVVAVVSQAHVNLNIRGNVTEVVARGAHPLVISMEGLANENDRYTFPAVHSMLTPLVTVIPLQLMSYYASLHRGCDIDKPRNLAKSVTVE